MRWTVNRRITLGFTIGLGLVIAIAILGGTALRRTANVYETRYAEAVRLRNTAMSAESDFRRANVDYLGWMLQPNDPELRSRDSMVAVTGSILAELTQSAGTAELRAVWANARDRLREWDEASREAMAFVRAGRTAEAMRVRAAETAPRRDAVRAAIQQGVTAVEARAEAAEAEARGIRARAQALLVIGTIIALLVGAGSAVVLQRAVGGALQRTGAGVAASAAQILAATTEQAAGAAQTSSAVAETVTTVEEVAQTAEQAAQRARTVAESARTAAEISTAGRKSVDDSVRGLEAVRERVEGIAASILALAEQAQAIGDIIATVNEVAERVNILALNAAVEAARAGEQGRGFAVVAAEIRTLADQSKKATVQVRQILGDIQRATSAAVMATEQGTKQVAAAAQQATEAGETIRRLAEAVATAAQASAQIAASAGQQAGGLTQMREAMSSIRQAAQQNLTATQQTERSARDLTVIGNQLLELIGAAPDGRT